MATGYTKEFLICAYLWRFTRWGIPIGSLQRVRELAEAFYDAEGKDKFRTYASLDAATLKEFIGE